MARTLSGGEKQMLAMAGFNVRPRLCMFDEPSTDWHETCAEVFRIANSANELVLLGANVQHTLEWPIAPMLENVHGPGRFRCRTATK